MAAKVLHDIMSNLYLQSEVQNPASGVEEVPPLPHPPSRHPSATPTHQPGPTATEAHSFLTSLLDRPLRVTLRDSRTVIGRLYVIDGGGNMVLSEAEEFPSTLLSLFDVNRARDRLIREGKTNTKEMEEVDKEEEEVMEDIQKRWERWGQWLPRSEPFGGPGTGWGGRELGLVLVKMDDCTRIELLDEPEDGANRERQEEEEHEMRGEGTIWREGVI